MDNEQTMQTEETTEQTMSADTYVKSLEDLKKNMVKKEKYDEVMADNARLVKALEEGGGYNKEEEAPAVDTEALRNKLFKRATYANDLEYFSDAMALRDAILAEGKPDPFLPFNKEYVPSEEDVARAQFIADEIKASIEYAKGDPMLFSNELQRRGVKINQRSWR